MVVGIVGEIWKVHQWVLLGVACFANSSSFAHCNYSDLQEFVIHPDYHLQGLGRAFLAHIVSLAQDQSIPAIVLTSTVGMRCNLAALYTVCLALINDCIALAGEPEFYPQCG